MSATITIGTKIIDTAYKTTFVVERETKNRYFGTLFNSNGKALGGSGQTSLHKDTLENPHYSKNIQIEN